MDLAVDHMEVLLALVSLVDLTAASEEVHTVDLMEVLSALASAADHLWVDLMDLEEDHTVAAAHLMAVPTALESAVDLTEAAHPSEVTDLLWVAVATVTPSVPAPSHLANMAPLYQSPSMVDINATFNILSLCKI